VAQVIALPSESDIAREIARDVDPDAVYAARQALRLAVMTSLSKTLAATCERLSSPEPYSPDADAAGRRALKNTCLDLITAGGEPTAIALAQRH
jgi:aminopeptidase N